MDPHISLQQLMWTPSHSIFFRLRHVFPVVHGRTAVLARLQQRRLLVELFTASVAEVAVVLGVEELRRTRAQVRVRDVMWWRGASQAADDVDDEADDDEGADGEQDEEAALPPHVVAWNRSLRFVLKTYFSCSWQSEC